MPAPRRIALRGAICRGRLIFAVVHAPLRLRRRRCIFSTCGIHGFARFLLLRSAATLLGGVDAAEAHAAGHHNAGYHQHGPCHKGPHVPRYLAHLRILLCESLVIHFRSQYTPESQRNLKARQRSTGIDFWL